MTTTAVAHIITADAVALGDPEILIMTPDEGCGAVLIEAHPLAADLLDSAEQPEAVLYGRGWLATGPSTQVGLGYFIVNVERMD